jgi:hypothetical protein
VSAVRAAWSSASFLLYTGGIVLAFVVVWQFGALAGEWGDFGLTAWSALVAAALAAAAALAQRAGEPVLAGLLAFSAVVAFGLFVGALEDWIGLLDDFDDSPFRGFRIGVLLLALVLFIASLVALSRFRFPLLVLLAAATGWFFVTDLISGGGSWSAIVTLAVGLVLLLLAVSLDADPESRPYAFWLHVAAGLTIGGGLIWFFRDSDLDFVLLGVAGLGYIALGDRLARSSWVVLGAWGLLQTTAHFATKWGGINEFFFPLFYLVPFFIFGGESAFDGLETFRPWLGALIFGIYALALIAIALLLTRRRRALPAP